MKKYIVLVIFLLSFSDLLFGQKGIYPVFPQNYTILQFVDEQNGWAGNLDCLFHTSDGGNTWDVQLNFEGIGDDGYGLIDYQISSANFINSLVGFLNVIDSDYQHYTFTTIDGGKHWTKYKISGPQLPLNNVQGMQFIDSQIGFAVYAYKYIIKTINGGKSWEIIYEDDSGISQILFISELLGYKINGWAPCKYTTDGGLSWQEVNINETTFLGFHYKDGITWISTGAGLYISEPAENLWTKINDKGFSNLQMVNDLEGFAYSTTSLSIFWMTKNGGIDWEEVPRKTNLISFVDINTGWIAQTDSRAQLLMKVTNEATEFNAATTGKINGVQVISNNEVVAIGANGLIIKSVDSGKSWSVNRDLYGKRLIDVCFANSNNGLIIGTHETDDLGLRGFVAKSTNNVENWELIKDFIADDPDWQRWENEETQWIRTLTTVGEVYRFNTKSRMYTSYDYGLSWTDTTLSNQPYARRKMRYTDNEFGIMINGNAELYRTIDGGINWIEIEDRYARDFSLISSDIGWFAFNESAHPMLKMSNQGTSWTETDRDASVVYFLDSSFGIYSGNASVGTNSDGTYYTENSGQTWTKFSTKVVYRDYIVNYNIDFADRELSLINEVRSDLYQEAFMSKDIEIYDHKNDE